MFPFVEAAVMFKQYTQSTETLPFSVVNLTIVELRLSILTPPFTFDTCTVVKRIVDGTNTLMLAVYLWDKKKPALAGNNAWTEIAPLLLEMTLFTIDKYK